MTMYVEVSCRCALCGCVTYMDAQDAERWTRAGAWSWFSEQGWQRHAHHKGGGMTGWTYVCPVCSAKPDLVQRLRKRLKSAATTKEQTNV